MILQTTDWKKKHRKKNAITSSGDVTIEIYNSILTKGKYRGQYEIAFLSVEQGESRRQVCLEFVMKERKKTTVSIEKRGSRRQVCFEIIMKEDSSTFCATQRNVLDPDNEVLYCKSTNDSQQKCQRQNGYDWMKEDLMNRWMKAAMNEIEKQHVTIIQQEQQIRSNNRNEAQSKTNVVRL